MLHFWISAASAAAPTSSLTSMSTLSKGLFTTVFGLVGVFLVLALFFVAIKLMQRTGKKTSDTKE